MAANQRDLTIATFNLFNLQSVGGLTYAAAPPFPDTPEGRGAYARKIAWIAAMLARLDADAIGFQELWARSALEAAFEAAGLAGAYDLVARDAPGPGRPQVALALRRGRGGESRLRGEPEWIEGFPETFRLEGLRETGGAREAIDLGLSTFSRPVLRARLQPDGRSPRPPEVALLVAHLKSKGPARLAWRDAPEALLLHRRTVTAAASHVRRVMEAGALRVLLDEAMAAPEGAPPPAVVVIGDLNDAQASITTEMITDRPRYRLVERSRTGQASARGLYSVERLQQYRSARDVYYTYAFQDQRESLDHILVSQAFYDHARARRWSFREMVLWNDHLDAPEEGASDHGIVRAAFDWNPMPEIAPS